MIPSLPEESLALLERHLKGSSFYLEYGSGGSTVLAASLGVSQIMTVESDKLFLEAVGNKVSEISSASVVKYYHVDIGQTKEWGYPADPSTAPRWPEYYLSAWRHISQGATSPDLIMIDGRFRVACFLTSLIYARPKTVILFDDYADRPVYHAVEQHLKPTLMAGRMAKFVVPDGVDVKNVILDLLSNAIQVG
jgi:hypothetical protein